MPIRANWNTPKRMNFQQMAVHHWNTNLKVSKTILLCGKYQILKKRLSQTFLLLLPRFSHDISWQPRPNAHKLDQRRVWCLELAGKSDDYRSEYSGILCISIRSMLVLCQLTNTILTTIHIASTYNSIIQSMCSYFFPLPNLTSKSPNASIYLLLSKQAS